MSTGVHNGTATGGAPPYTQTMRTTYVNAIIAALSIIAAGAVGLLAPVTTPSGWFILAAVATAPALVFIHYLRRPPQTMSESIKEAIR